MGKRQELHQDEIDAVTDFLNVTFNPEITDVRQKIMLLKPTSKDFEANFDAECEEMCGKVCPCPFEERTFDEHIKPSIVDKLLERGIINTQNTRMWMKDILKGTKHYDELRDYLLSKPSVTDKPDFAWFRLPQKGDDLLAHHKHSLESYHTKAGKDKHRAMQYAEYARDTKKMRNFVAVQKESLRAIFATTVQRQLGKHYAINRKTDCEFDFIVMHKSTGWRTNKWPSLEGCAAIPADNGKPQYNSLFGTSLERLYYSAFAFMQNNVSALLLDNDLEDWTRLINTEKGNFHGHNFKKQNKEWQKLKVRYHGFIDVLEEEDDGLAVLNEYKTGGTVFEWVNAEPYRQLPFIQQYYFPKIRVYAEEIQSTTHFFPLIAKADVKQGKREFQRLQGMSGTLFNRHTYPRNQFQFKDAVSDTTYVVAKRILQAYPRIDNAPNGKYAVVRAVNITADASLVADAIAKLSLLGAGSILDTTGYLEKLQGKNIAKTMLRHAAEAAKHDGRNGNIKAAVYYAGDDLMEIDLRGVEKPYKKEKGDAARARLVAFWDVGHTTGSDIPVSKTQARATMIVGKHLRLFELMQGAMRLRQLGSGQRIEFVVRTMDREVMLAKLTDELGMEFDTDPETGEKEMMPEHVIQYAALLESLGEASHNYRAVDMRLKMAIIAPMMDLLWSSDVKDSSEVFDIVRELFVKRTVLEPWQAYASPSTEVSIQQAKVDKARIWKAKNIVYIITGQCEEKNKACNNHCDQGTYKTKKACNERCEQRKCVSKKSFLKKKCKQANVSDTWLEQLSEEFDTIIKELDCEDASLDCMPLPDNVQQSSNLGNRQKVMQEVESEAEVEVEVEVEVEEPRLVYQDVMYV
jgi:hypothetical protein